MTTNYAFWLGEYLAPFGPFLYENKLAGFVFGVVTTLAVFLDFKNSDAFKQIFDELKKELGA